MAILAQKERLAEMESMDETVQKVTKDIKVRISTIALDISLVNNKAFTYFLGLPGPSGPVGFPGQRGLAGQDGLNGEIGPRGNTVLIIRAQSAFTCAEK